MKKYSRESGLEDIKVNADSLVVAIGDARDSGYSIISSKTIYPAKTTSQGTHILTIRRKRY